MMQINFDFTNEEYATVDLLENTEGVLTFGIRSTIIERLLTEHKQLIVMDNASKSFMRLTPFDMSMDKKESLMSFSKHHDNHYFLYLYKWVEEPVMIDEWESKLLHRFNGEWLNILRPVLNTSWFKEINKAYNVLERKTIVIRPNKERVFRVFSSSPVNIRVVFCFQDPYPSAIANGIALATDENVAPPTLQKVEDAIRSEIDYEDKYYLPYSLQHLVQQGVFLMNAALTVRQGEPSSHFEGWKPFAKEVISALSNLPGKIIFVFCGSKVEGLSRFIDKTKHSCFTLEHPARAAYEERDWEHKGIFSQINYELSLYSKEISWLVPKQLEN